MKKKSNFDVGNWARAAGLMVIVSFMGAPGALAQDRQLDELLNKLSRMEREIKALNRQIYKDELPGAKGAVAPKKRGIFAPEESSPPNSEAGGDAYIIRVETRIGEMENEIRTMTGNFENITHTLNQLSARIEKLVGDVDLRLSDLEGGARSRLRPSTAGRAAPPKISDVPNVQSVRKEGPASGGPSFATPVQSLGTISDKDLKLIESGKRPAPDSKISPERASAEPAPVDKAAAPPPPKPVKKESVLPKGSIAAQYKYAQKLVSQTDYEKAAAAFHEFITIHSTEPLAANARYWLGETYYVRHDYRAAAEAFLDGFRANPKGPKAPDILLKLGMSLTNLDKKKEACAMFQKLESDFPDAPGRIKILLEKERARAVCG
ncbi:MAG: tol-pal system protein YbgF [Rhodospirillales bacterium]|nr:tol-pal system protein YbgF [Rhodospirillales bacterium]